MLLPLNTIRWRERFAQPDWYLGWVESPEYRRLTEPPVGPNDTERAELKEAVLSFFEEEIREDRVALGAVGPDWDTERAPVNTVIIHHTGNPSGISLERLNAIQLLKLYAPHYARSPELCGRPIWSNHVREGRPVFWAYHWLVRSDGSYERLLEDREIGWQAGNWAVNRSSVAVCLDGNFEQLFPPAPMLYGAAELIGRWYGRVVPNRILGHGEINPSTLCPGRYFADGWKRTILHRLCER